MLQHRLVFVVLGALVCLVGCGQRGGGGGRGPAVGVDAGSPPADPRCPEVPAFTGMACRTDQIGALCPGNVMCACSGTDFRTVPSDCTCNEDPSLGRIFECAEACAAACMPDAGMAGAGDAGPPPPTATCADFCAHMMEITCPMMLPDCEGVCASIRAMGCEMEFDTYIQCAVTSPLECREGYPIATGCAAEDAAWGACSG